MGGRCPPMTAVGQHETFHGRDSLPETPAVNLEICVVPKRGHGKCRASGILKAHRFLPNGNRSQQKEVMHFSAVKDVGHAAGLSVFHFLLLFAGTILMRKATPIDAAPLNVLILACPFSVLVLTFNGLFKASPVLGGCLVRFVIDKEGAIPLFAKRAPVRQGAKASSPRVVVSRHRFSEDFRRGLVQKTLVRGASVAKIALEHGLTANLLFKWRRLYLRELAGASDHPPKMLPVTIEQVLAAQSRLCRSPEQRHAVARHQQTASRSSLLGSAFG